MTQYPATRTPSPAPSAGIDLKTLWITAVSSAAAAYVTSKVWAPGTLAAAAFTPVLVAILREGLAKSTDVVAKAVPVKGVVRSARPEGPPSDADMAGGGREAGDVASSPQPPGSLLADDSAARVAQPGEISYHGTASPRARNWRVAIITGLLGFVIAAVVFTVPELVAGNSASGGGRGTTMFGGQGRNSDRTPAVKTTTNTTPSKTETTAPGQPTVTVPPETVTTPEPATTVPEPEDEIPPAPATPAPAPAAEPPPPGEVPPG